MDSLLTNIYGRLVALERLPYSAPGGNILYKCKCDCGNFCEVTGSNLRMGKTRSCGCLATETAKNNKTTHNMSKYREYYIWKTMKQRCLNKNNSDFYLYGGRGICVCDTWLSFENFYKDIGSIPKGMTLDRIDNDGNYEPSNCRLILNTEQAKNKRTNVKLTYKGITKILSEWALVTGFNSLTISRRVSAGWAVEDALEIIPKKGGHYGNQCKRTIPNIE